MLYTAVTLVVRVNLQRRGIREVLNPQSLLLLVNPLLVNPRYPWKLTRVNPRL